MTNKMGKKVLMIVVLTVKCFLLTVNDEYFVAQKEIK